MQTELQKDPPATQCELEKLGIKYQANKLFHNYLKRYDFHCAPKRFEVKRILEIGVDKGVSLKMWAEYFPNAEIVGLDRELECKKLETDRIKIVVCDSSSEDCLKKLKEINATEFDIIIDDGSHWYWNQINTFKLLFPLLKYGGIYFVEDMGFPDHPLRYKGFEAFGELVNGINYYPEGTPFSLFADKKVFEFPDVKNYWIKNVVGVSFYRFMVVVEKGHNPEDNIYWQIPQLAHNQKGLTQQSLEDNRKKIKVKKISQLKNYIKLFFMVFTDYNRRFFIPRSESTHSGLFSMLKGIWRMVRQVRVKKDA